MTILDAYAVVALLRGEPAALEVSALLDRGDAVLTAVGVAEALDHMVRLVGADEEEAALDLQQLGLLDAVTVDASLGAGAGRLRARNYHRSRRAVSMADCIAAAAGEARDEPVATTDPHLLDLCHDEGIATMALTGSDGSRWVPPA